MRNPLANDIFKIAENDKLILNLFWTGVIIYISAFAISTTQQVNYILCNLFQILGIAFFMTASVLLIHFRIENGYLKVVFSIYCLWILGVIVRGFQFNYESIKLILFNAYESIFIYLSPLVLLLPKNLNYIKKLFSAILITGLVYISFDILFIRDLIINYDIKNSQAIVEYFSKTLSIPCGFILLTYIYHPRKTNLLALAVIILTFLFAIIRARRGLAFLALCPLMASYIVYLVYSKNRTLKVIFFIVIFVLVTFGVAYSQSIITYFSQNSATSWFLQRITQDTRNEVEQYFYMDMKPTDWVIGKGINGQYFCPGVVEGEGRVSIFRRGIETDYLTIILKGGIISLGLMLLIFIPAIIQGLFHSKNMLAKASALWILFYLIDLYPAPVTAFTLNYLIVWIAAGICYSKELRNCSDSVLAHFFLRKKPVKKISS